MASRHRICDETRLAAEGSRVIVEVEGREVAVFNVDGEYHALPNHCIHQGAPLCEGELTGRMTVDDDWEWVWEDEGTVITCPWHAWKFDVTTGKNVKDDRYRLPQYEVEVEDGTVYVRR